MVVPDKPQFLAKVSGGKRMPIYRDLLADMETPLSAYWKIANEEVHSFLLESVTGGEQVSRYSLIGIRPTSVLRTKDRDWTLIGSSGQKKSGQIEPGTDPLTLLKEQLAEKELVHVPGLPAFVGGAVGMLGYDLVRFFEELPGGPVDDLKVDDLAMMLMDIVV
ncbi:MAG TPA: hypothetical protein VJ835_04265, partial [Fimbriimonadaceae bacterium]|nr:hypothetical protein [Fimbriimonadaceae bacterium]